MKREFFIWCFMLTCFCGFSQHQRFVYLGTYKPDKTEEHKVAQLFALDVSNGKSLFHSIENPDSREKYIQELASYKSIVGWDLNWYIYKSKGRVDFAVNHVSTTYEYGELDQIQWKITDRKLPLDGYSKAQLAETEFGGRQWLAYFDTEIPVFDGPYKFSGLPGLIVKLESLDGDYMFELIAKEQVKEASVDKPLNTIKLKKTKYLELMRSKAKNPIADWRVYYKNMGYSDVATVVVNGVSMTLNQMLKEDEIVEKLWQEQHNNPVERDDVWLKFGGIILAD
ncbi:GLPGLI family protein [Flavobacterium sp. NKUCC04_CG]|uniref:GLPGLI family protein n=1 Tax=Flavobacterium sp. NKUCC04_CG TaxID=2842121 RepID=UPI001C5BC53B|nr:GLPGLI family protein [Flavobacterium sp. NKUCC04_CG]MBW3518294.1 GLPGLI family protein [Flavobacterium sp. NKUCC04_CG]